MLLLEFERNMYMPTNLNYCTMHTSFMIEVMLRTSVETMREEAMMHHMVNSVLYSVSVIPGQWMREASLLHP